MLAPREGLDLRAATKPAPGAAQMPFTKYLLRHHPACVGAADEERPRVYTRSPCLPTPKPAEVLGESKAGSALGWTEGASNGYMSLADLPAATGLAAHHLGTPRPLGLSAIMNRMGPYLSHGEPLVVETDDAHYLGTAEVVGDFLLIRSGRAGRPFRVRVEDVVRVGSPTDGAEDD
jgi:hypothetical protein